MRKIILALCIFLLVLPATSGVVSAQNSVTLEAAKDNTILDDATESSNGAGEYFFAGTSGEKLGNNRSLIYFDLSEAVPSESVIDSVVLSLNITKGSRIDPISVSIHRLNKSWGEGDSKGPSGEGKGAPADNGDATWIHNFFNTDTWDTPGGDFEASASAGTDITLIGRYDWKGPGLVDDVNLWLDDESKNHGWILIGQEDSAQSSKKISSRQNPIEENRPSLTLYFHEESVSAMPSARFGENTLSVNAYPNPFRETLTIKYSIEKGEAIQLGIYNLLGQEIRHISKGFQSPGNYQISWEGIDRSGKSVSSGMYYVIFVKGEDRQVLKIMKSR